MGDVNHPYSISGKRKAKSSYHNPFISSSSDIPSRYKYADSLQSTSYNSAGNSVRTSTRDNSSLTKAEVKFLDDLESHGLNKTFPDVSSRYNPSKNQFDTYIKKYKPPSLSSALYDHYVKPVVNLKDTVSSYISSAADTSLKTAKKVNQFLDENPFVASAALYGLGAAAPSIARGVGAIGRAAGIGGVPGIMASSAASKAVNDYLRTKAYPSPIYDRFGYVKNIHVPPRYFGKKHLPSQQQKITQYISRRRRRPSRRAHRKAKRVSRRRYRMKRKSKKRKSRRSKNHLF